MATHPTALDRARLGMTLAQVLDHALPACAEMEYRLVGTAAALMHGVDLPVRDLDFLVRERRAVDGFARALAPFECAVAPGWLPDAHQYFARFVVGGVEVEFSTVEGEAEGDLSETVGRGPWEHSCRLPCGRHEIAVVALELRLLTELRRGRVDRYQPILQHLRVHGGDLALVRRGLDHGGLSPDARDQVLRQLAQTPR